MSDQITYDDKADLIVDTTIDDMFKVSASDMNEIKEVVNTNVEIVDEINKPENWVSVGTTAPTDGRRVWFAKGKNLFDKNIAIIGGRLDTSGRIITQSNGFYSNFISVKANTTYTKNSPEEDAYHRVCFYSDANVSSFISRSESNTFTTPGNCKYLRFCGYDTEINTTMLEKGSSATTYEPYINPSINVDEEEWYNPNNIEKYSTKEIKIGTWIDGKPLYRKVVDIGTLPNATTKHVAHNISNIGSVVTLRGIVTDYRFFPVPFSATSNAFAISIFADTTNIDVMTGNDRSNMTGFVIIEYTKTTD